MSGSGQAASAQAAAVVPGDKLWYFTSTSLFAGAGQPPLARLAAASTMRRVSPRQMIYRSGDASDMVYLISAGQVRLFRCDAEGEETTIAVLGPLELFGERALAGEEAREEGAEAMVASLVCDIPRGDFLAALEGSPELAFRLSRLFALRTRRLECRLTDLIFKGAEARLCTVLLELAADHGRRAADGSIEIPLTLTARDFGRLAGLGRQTTSTLLTCLRRQGLVEGDPRRLRLVELGGLRRRAGVDPAPAGIGA